MTPSTIDEDALDLGAEIGVAGGVDDVDVGGRRRAPLDRGAFGEDGDPALFLEVVGIHRPLLDALVVAEGAGLAEELVDERRLAVIDVRDDRDVAQVHRFSRERFGGPVAHADAAMQHEPTCGKRAASGALEDFDGALDRA